MRSPRRVFVRSPSSTFQLKRRALAVGAGVAATIAAVALLVATANAPLRRTTVQLPSGVVARLSITVEERDGTTRHAYLECAGRNASSGYLADPNARASACETALVNPSALDYLHGEKVVGCQRKDRQLQSPAVVRFKGAIRPRSVDRVLRVDQDKCGVALVELLRPLLEPSNLPNLRPLSR